jgi:hypothetical protein
MQTLHCIYGIVHILYMYMLFEYGRESLFMHADTALCFNVYMYVLH